MDTDFRDTTIDSTKPNAGRIYEYLIGGNVYFDIDKQMAEKLLAMAPFASDYAKLTRWFLGEGIDRAVELGFTQFLDLASGIPTADHIHENTPEGTKVIYSDIDPVTVAHGKKLIGDNPLVKYIACDAAKPEILLESGTVKSLFGDNHKVAIGLNEICWFLKDEQIRHTMNVLYEWASKGSILFLTNYNSENPTKELQTFLDMYKNLKQPFYPTTISKFMELIKPWELEKPGFLTLEEWIGEKQTITKKSMESMGGSIFAGFLKK